MKLTTTQSLIYDMEKFSGGAISVICGSIIHKGTQNDKKLIWAVNELYRLNDTLRIHITETGGQAVQTICEYHERDIEVLHFESKSQLDDFAEKYAKEPLDLFGELCRISVIQLPDGYGILAKLHHLVCDAWTLSLMGTQFNKLLNGETVTSCSYVDYAESENVYMNSKRYEKDKSFFLEQFKKCDEVTYLSEKQAKTFSATRKTFVIEQDRTDSLMDFANANGISIFALFMTALSVYISRTKLNEENFYIGTAVLNRTNEKEKNTAGMFINTVPVLVNLCSEKSFAENLEKIECANFSVFRHQKYNYGSILQDLRSEYNFTEKLYDIILSYQNAAIVSKTDFESTWYHCGMQNESLQVHVEDHDCEGILKVHYDYQTEKFIEYEIDILHLHIMNLLFDGIKNSNKKIHELNLLTETEQQKLLFDFNDTAIDYPKDKCVHELFEEQVLKTPDKTAVIACDKTLTYNELNEQANKITHSLIEKGVKQGDIVAFILRRRSYLIAAMFGILKSGAAYLPIDPDYPQDRIEFMLEDSKAKFCVKEENIHDLLSNSRPDNPNIAISSETLCYCIYTSGSTGKPKGTLLTHSNVVNYINSNNNNVVHRIIKESYRNIVSVTTVGFDIFVTESLLPLANGMETLLANEEQAKLQSKLNDLIKLRPADVIQTTPTKMKSLIADKTQLDYLKAVRAIILGGEALDSSLVEEVNKITNAQVFNIYGPTEATVWATNAEINDTDITIGKPIANTQIYIVDKYMQLMPIGVTGELCIAGDGVGAGYLNRPELTTEKFIDNPFGKGKLYKTGDLAYWREDGNIVYVGRNDFQVKIRGLRIELGEIENVISSVNGVLQSVVIVRKDENGRQLICAFYTEKEAVPLVEIKKSISKKLPKYMMPHIFTRIDEMPLTSSGKVNRKALPEVDLKNIKNSEKYAAPKTQMQKELCRLLANTLSIDCVGITDDFFDIGCDSLKAIEFISCAHSEGIYFPLQYVFDYPTVEKLCDAINQDNTKKVEYNTEDFVEIHKMLQSNEVGGYTAEKIDMGDIFLAGSTGFLGMHILAEYLNCEQGKAYCLVRGADLEQAQIRFVNTLEYYFGAQYTDLVGNRITVVCGDIEKENLGLERMPQVETFINAAASVKHYGSYDYFKSINTQGVINAMKAAKKVSARFIHISTLSVSGNSMVDAFDSYRSKEAKTFSEKDLYIGQSLDNVYIRSKFEGECAVFREMLGGMRANVIRVGNLTNRVSDMKFQPNYQTNAFLARVKAVLDMGAIPDYLMDLYSEFSPVDDTAKAIIKIAQHFNNQHTVFHLNSPKVVYFNKFVEYTKKLNIKMEVKDEKSFATLLSEISKNESTKYIHEALINDIDENERLNYDSNIHIENEYTLDYLAKLGFDWSEIDFEYIKSYIEYFRKIGYLK